MTSTPHGPNGPHGRNGPSSPQGLPLARLLELTADAVQAVRSGRSLNDALARCPADARPGVQALSFTVLRRLGSAQVLRQALAPRTPPPAVEALLLTALALLWPASASASATDAGEGADTRPAYPDHTLVDQAVAAVRRRQPQAAGFVNAVLRRFGRERQALVAEALRQPLARHNHPPWWAARLQADWPAQAEALLAAANRHPPMTLRANARRGTGAAYLQRLQAAGLGARLLGDADVPGLGGQAIVLDRPCAVGALPGFAEGEVSVQDAAAQRAARLLLGLNPGAVPLPPGARVLDACAAPGGKTAQLLELADIELLALDSDAQRLQRVDETLRRLHLPASGSSGHPPAPGSTCTLRAADASQPAAWWDGRPFDAILLDAPCTASGIVRRHPDVRWLRRPDDIAALARTQAALLQALWPLLAPGGRLLYATCSLFKAEGQDQIDAFLQRLGPAAARLDGDSPGHLLPLADNPAHGAGGGAVLQDGFFYALIHKP